MSRIAHGLALSLLAMPACAAVVDPGQELLQQARHWQEMGRPQEAQQALERFYRLSAGPSPQHAEALTLQALGQLQLKQDKQAAQTLAKLRALYPGHPGIARVEQMQRVLGADRGKLLRAHELFAIGKVEEAYAAFNEVYQGRPPDGPLALEYWQVAARLPGSWERARAELQAIVARGQSNHAARLALSNIYLLHPPVPRAVLDELKTLSGFDDSRGDALAQWRRALLQADQGWPQADYQAYLERAPDDATVRAKMDEVQANRQRQQTLLADPAYRALLAAGRELDANRLDLAERDLKLAAARYRQLPEYWQSLGRLREKQGRYGEAVASYRSGQTLGGDGWGPRIAGAQLAADLARIGEAMKQQDWSGARRLLDAARQAHPEDADVLLAQADWEAAQGHAAAARDGYWLVLRRRPDSGAALAGLMGGYLDQGRFDEAGQLLAAIPAAQRAKLGESYVTAQAQLARARGDAWLDKGQAGPALPYLRQAVTLQPQNVWNRYALASALLALGKGEEGSALLNELAAPPQADPANLYAYALFESKRDANRAALGALERVPPAARTPGMAALQRRVWLNQTVALAVAEVAQGRPDPARQRLLAAESAMGDDVARLGELAAAWQRLGETARARRLLQSLYLRQPTLDSQLAYADLLLGQGELAAAQPLLDAAMHERERMRAEQRQTLDGLRADLAVAQAEQARAAGRQDEADAILRRAAALAPDSASLQRGLLAIDLRQKNWPAAISRAGKLLDARPNDEETRLSLLDAEIGAGRLADARAVADSLLQPAADKRDPDFTLRVLDRVRAMGEAARADRELDRLLASGAATPGVYLQLAERARAAHRPDEALKLYRQGLALSAPQPAAADVPAAPPTGPLQPLPAEDARQESLHRGYAELRDERSVKVWQGADLLYRRPGDGTPGTSQMSMWQAPLWVEMPAGGEGRYFLRADAVSMNAGTLDLDAGNNYTLNRFGSVAACAANSTPQACAAVYGNQSARGAALGLGYESERWRLDIGHSPIGFPVSNLLGGARYSGSLSTLNYKLELSRRPLTSSLLTYAGVRDPFTGQTWGGVVADSIGGSLGYDQGGRFGVWSNFAYQQLTGKNVESNSNLTAMAGIYWRLLDEPARSVTLGLNSINFWYRKNLGGFTFGQGGYYSPQRYDSLSLPLRYAARNERWSYFVRGSVSVSSAREDAAPFYPTRPDLQAAAGNPFFSASSGPGSGYELSGAFEYQASPTLAFGGMLDVQHSQFFQPSRLVLYLRYQPDGASQPLPFPVEPLQPYSGF